MVRAVTAAMLDRTACRTRRHYATTRTGLPAPRGSKCFEWRPKIAVQISARPMWRIGGRMIRG